MQVIEHIKYRTQWVIRKYANDADFEDGHLLEPPTVIDGNLLLTAGITELLQLLCGTGSPIAFSNANARLGVGDSTTAESAGQTDLQAASNKTYKGMSATYPQVSGATVTWRAVFTGAEANYAWQEFVVDNGGTGLKRLNRKVSNQGTKASGQTWTLDLAITFS